MWAWKGERGGGLEGDRAERGLRGEFYLDAWRVVREWF